MKNCETLGLVKAYTTRVGEGPFPTELSGDTGEKLATIGQEVGTVTGRGRRCGWFDVPLVKKIVAVSGIDHLVLTKLDVLDSFETIQVCTHYTLDGEPIDYVPSLLTDIERLYPVYETFEGWQRSTADCTRFTELPAAAQSYVNSLADRIGVSFKYISTAPETDKVIIMEDSSDA